MRQMGVDGAATLAGLGLCASVILVDSDIRRPAPHRIFEAIAHRGLAHRLLGHATPKLYTN